MFKQFRFVVPVTLAAVLVAEAAQAQCEFGSGVGTKLKVPLVRAYQECAGSLVSTETESGWGGCSPIRPEPLGYECSESGSSCSGVDGGACPRHFCGFVLHRVPGTDGDCATNSDCPTYFYAPYGVPITNGVCEDHPNNACAAVPGADHYRFAPGGSCTLSASSKVEKDCSRLTSSEGIALGLPARACHVTKLRARCRKIIGSDGLPIGPLSDDWLLRTVTRATFDDNESGDMTQIDFPVIFRFGEPRDGSIDLDVTTAEALLPILGPMGAALPPCTNLQPVDFRVMALDGSGEWGVFAQVGLATQP